MSFVIEVACENMPMAATPEVIAAVAAARAGIPRGIHLIFAAHLEPWVSEEHFKGAKLKYGCVGGGSLRRCGGRQWQYAKAPGESALSRA